MHPFPISVLTSKSTDTQILVEIGLQWLQPGRCYMKWYLQRVNKNYKVWQEQKLEGYYRYNDIDNQQQI